MRRLQSQLNIAVIVSALLLPIHPSGADTCFEVFARLGAVTMQCAENNYFANNSDFSVFTDLAESGTGTFEAAYDGLDLFGGPDPNNARPANLIEPYSANTDLGTTVDAVGITEFTVTHGGEASFMPRDIAFQSAGYDTRSRVIFMPVTTGNPATPVAVTINVAGTVFMQDGPAGSSTGAAFAGANFLLAIPGGGGPSFDGVAELDLAINPAPTYIGDFSGSTASATPAGPNAFDVAIQEAVTFNLTPNQQVTLDSGSFGTLFSDGYNSGDTGVWKIASTNGVVFTVSSTDPNVRFQVIPDPPSPGSDRPKIVGWTKTSQLNDVFTFDIVWTSQTGSSYRVDFSHDGSNWMIVPGQEDVAGLGALTQRTLTIDLGNERNLLVRVLRK